MMLWEFTTIPRVQGGVDTCTCRSVTRASLRSLFWKYHPHLTDKEIGTQSFAPAHGKEGTGTQLLPQRDSHGVQRSPGLHRDATRSPEEGG